MDKMELYERVRVCPPEAQKTIGAGRLKGMTDINPMWRIQKLTEEFGVCGIGWYYEIIKQWIEDGANGEKVAFCNINLYVRDGDVWSKPIQGTGGSMLIANERSGQHTSDECFKMALTDAISVSCKALGFAADVYWKAGRSKYTAEADVKVYKCDYCGKEFTDYTKADGTYYSADEMYRISQKKHNGRAYCTKECAQAAETKEDIN